MRHAEAEAVVPATLEVLVAVAVVVAPRRQIMHRYSQARTPASVLEGQTAVITVEASDEDSDTLTYALSGMIRHCFLSAIAISLLSLRRRILKRQGIVVLIMCTALLLPWMTERDSVTQSVSVTVLDAFEGRVIDGPVSGATVFVDVDGDYVADAGEPTGTTDSNGLFFIEKGDVSISAASKLISIGGTDTTTNAALPNLALVSDVPTAATASAYITAVIHHRCGNSNTRRQKLRC